MSNSRRRETDPKCHLVHTHFCAVVLDTVNSISPFLPFLPITRPPLPDNITLNIVLILFPLRKVIFYIYTIILSLLSLYL